MRTLKRIALYRPASDLTLSKFAMYLNIFGGILLLWLGSRYVGQLHLPPAQHLLGLAVVLLVSLSLIGLGVLVHLYELVKQAVGRRD